jgi:predicted dehydrogenase
MYNTILVPLDRSKRAEVILQHVENLALKCKSKVIFMKVIDVSPVRIAHSRKPYEQHRKELEAREKRDGEYLADLQRVFREKGIDAVMITTPNHVHYDAARTFLKAGIDVLCDKPLTNDFYEAVDLVRLTRESGLVFGVCYAMASFPMVRRASALLTLQWNRTRRAAHGWTAGLGFRVKNHRPLKDSVL